MTSDDTADHSLPSGVRAVAAVREKLLRIAGGADIQAFDRLDSRVTQQSFRCKPEIEIAAANCLAAEARAICTGDLVAHLVTARTDSRPDSRGDLPAEGGDARLDDPREQTDPACVQHRQPGAAAVLPREGDRQAIGGERQQGHAILVGPETVAVAAAFGRLGAVHQRRVRLAVHGEPFGIRPDGFAEPAPVLVDVRGIVVRAQAEIERAERPAAYSAATCREGDRVRLSCIPGDEGRAHVSRARARSINSSRVLSAGSSTTASSSASSVSPTAGLWSYPSPIRSAPSTARSLRR